MGCKHLVAMWYSYLVIFSHTKCGKGPTFRDLFAMGCEYLVAMWCSYLVNSEALSIAERLRLD